MNIESMRAIVAKSDNPETEIQYKLNSDHTNIWIDSIFDLDRAVEVANAGKYCFRIKPATITLNGEDLPRPRIKGNRIGVCGGVDGYYIVGFGDEYKFTTESDAEKVMIALEKLMNS